MKSFGYTFSATLIARLSSLISFPVTARVLTVADLGNLTLWHTARGLILLAIFMGLPDVVAREAGLRGNYAAFRTALATSFLALGVVAIGGEIWQLATKHGVGLPYPHLLLVAAAVDVVPGLFMGTLPASGRTRAYALCVVVPALSVSLLTVMLLRPPFALGMLGPLLAHIAASLVNGAMCLWLYRTAPAVDPSIRHAPPTGLLAQSLPVLGIGLVGMSIATVDRYSIRFFSGAEALGYYAVAYQTAALLSFGGGAVRSSIVSQVLRDSGDREALDRHFNNYVSCGAMFAVLLAALSPEVIRLLAGQKFVAYASTAPVLCAAMLALESFSFGQVVATAQRRPHAAFRSIVAGAVVALLLVPLGAWLYGPAGVGVGLLCAYGVAVAAVAWRRVRLSLRSIAWLVATAFALAAFWIAYREPMLRDDFGLRIARFLIAGLATFAGLFHLHKLGRHADT